MSTYKVKLGESIVEVDGLAGLVKLVQEGKLTPEDPVFVPSTNRWHYARSVRQLREYFPGTPEPPVAKPPVAKEPEAEEPPPANVLQMRRGRWDPDGKGVDVPVFTYDVDLEPPPGMRWVRLGVAVGVGLFFGGMVWMYLTSYSRHLAAVEAKMEVGPRLVQATPRQTAKPSGTADPAPTARTPGKTPGKTTGATTGKATAVATATATATASAPASVRTFDAAAATRKVLGATITPVKRPDDFGNAIRKDLARIAVPIRAVTLKPKAVPRGQAAPFVCTVEYVRPDGVDDAIAAKHEWMALAMVGRRANELKLRLDSVRLVVRTGKKTAERVVPADLVLRIGQGSASPDDLSRLPLVRR